METQQDLDHHSTSLLPLIDSPNDPPKLKLVESTVFEIKEGRLNPPGGEVEKF